MFGVAPLEIQSLQDSSDVFLYPAGNKGQIDLWIMAQHYLVKKNIHLAIAYHSTPLRLIEIACYRFRVYRRFSRASCTTDVKAAARTPVG